MGYPDYLYPSEIKESFITSHQVLDFLRSYADHFELRPHIKLQHEVIRVRPRVDDWEVSADVMINVIVNVNIDFIFSLSLFLFHSPALSLSQVYVWDHVNDTCDPVYYDFIYVCNGHYTEPDMPTIEGMELYQGEQMHSHLYRRAEKFKGEKYTYVYI